MSLYVVAQYDYKGRVRGYLRAGKVVRKANATPYDSPSSGDRAADAHAAASDYPRNLYQTKPLKGK